MVFFATLLTREISIVIRTSSILIQRNATWLKPHHQSLHWHNLLNAKRTLQPAKIATTFQTDRSIHLTATYFVIVKVPAFADSVAEGDVKFTCKVGDSVAVDENVMEIETDKTAVPVPSPKAGKIVKIFVNDGDTVKPGENLYEVE